MCSRAHAHAGTVTVDQRLTSQQLLNEPGWLVQQSIVMAAASAVLGPLLDGQHSTHAVLHYHHPTHISLSPLLELETTWWTAVLFAIAGVILGVSHPLLDAAAGPEGAPRSGTAPSWPVVLSCITVFVLQYAASGSLEAPLRGVTLGPIEIPALDTLLAAVAAATWAAFDGSRQGLALAALTAIAGPAVEACLINGLHLYHYEHPSFLGIPSWIAFVYACGGPAVGGLGRRVSTELLLRRQPGEGEAKVE